MHELSSSVLDRKTKIQNVCWIGSNCYQISRKFEIRFRKLWCLKFVALSQKNPIKLVEAAKKAAL